MICQAVYCRLRIAAAIEAPAAIVSIVTHRGPPARAALRVPLLGDLAYSKLLDC